MPVKCLNAARTAIPSLQCLPRLFREKSKKAKNERSDLMAITDSPILTFIIDLKTAKRYREANKMPHQFRRAA